MIILRGEVNDRRSALLRLAVRLLYDDRHAVAHYEILLFIDLHERRGGHMRLELLLYLVHLRLGNPRIELFQRSTKIPAQQDFLIAFTPEGTLPAQFFCVMREPDFLAQLGLQKMPQTLLPEDVFGIIVAHVITTCILQSEL